mgnify:CR=1 FL=1
MPSDPERYAAGLREANRREEARISERSKRAREEAARLARAIADADPSVRAVYLFGSLAEGEPRRLEFDIDLALEGGDVYAALAVTEQSAFSVDVVALDRVPAHVRERVEQHGQALYRRG